MRHLYLFLLLILFVQCKTDTDKKVDQAVQSVLTEVSEQPEIKTPDEFLGDLFTEVQLQQVFKDGKTFVDCTAKYPYDEIVSRYNEQKVEPGFELEAFVLEHFETPPLISTDFKSDPNRTPKEHVEALWPVLERKADDGEKGSTLLPLPEPYIVPGGRFREVYYWDSYFTMIGLAESGKMELVESMLDNFAYLIETIGHIPNGNRTYYVSRSQPPFFAYMINLYAAHRGDEVYETYRDALREEYQFWMKGCSESSEPILHCVPTEQGIMNRYYDARNIPRQESYREDYELVEKAGGGEKMYRDLRSGAESGWDYSTRWFADARTMATIETTDIIPVDLNALLYGMEAVLVRSFPEDTAFVKDLQDRMEDRKNFMTQVLWNEEKGIFSDYNWVDKKTTSVSSLATVYPLFVGMATQEQADKIATYIRNNFLKPGGVVTSLNHSGQQWDAPNGWAPLQWMTVMGLERYGHSDLARTIAERWVALNEKVYANTGKFVEKYNVEDMSLEAGGGEYPVQDGFGWSNGVYLGFKAYLAEN
ncbi:alpha,alpha-trehalase TreF [Zeaxanthinibacter enoshimensis]|uniref:alpha,alpha-trehalase TreF n=1 Tax=Zeaxanthinibacter enoshimensis TaxID=392009 RepID=UPI0035676A94